MVGFELDYACAHIIIPASVNLLPIQADFVTERVNPRCACAPKLNDYSCNHNVIIGAKFAHFKKSKSLNFVRVKNCYIP